MKIKSFYSDPFTGNDVTIHDDEFRGYTVDRIRELFEHYPEVYKISLFSDYPFIMYYERLGPDEEDEDKGTVVHDEFSSEEDEEEVTKVEYGNWWD